MKYLQSALLGMTLFSGTVALAFEPIQNEQYYQVYLDLNAVSNDRLPVQIVPPLIDLDSAEFHMPRIIPGTYDVHDYGRFVNNFRAVSALGEELKTRKIDDNRWMIYNARALYKISYEVEDTYDYEGETDIFEPAGTTLEDDVFLLNNFGFVGYIQNYKERKFQLLIEKPAGFYGSTSLVGNVGDSIDSYMLDDYFTLHDNPLMYNIPDTASRMVGGAKVLVSVYSGEKVVTAQKSMESISAVLDAAAQYLGGNLPVEKYAVLIYCVPMEKAGTSYGALEHHTSTVLYMPEFDGPQFYGGVRDITAHEFFHIITPLGIHSQMISDFDFINPEMSQHIWFYEGVTEYNSHLVQARSGLYEISEFLNVIREKMESADGFNQHIPLTVASEFTLGFLKDEYYNFYQKGALAGMALDLKLLELSDGQYQISDLLQELGDTYGADTFFVDDRFFDIISEITYSEMREFFARHFEGTEPLPLQELLATVGIEYFPEAEVQRMSLGNVDFGYNFETGRIRVESIEDLDDFGRDFGWEVGDEIVEFNGQAVDLANLSDVIQGFYNSTEVGDRVTVIVARPNEDGEYKDVKLKGRASMGVYTETNFLQLMDDPSVGQLQRRKVWINQ